MCSLLTGALLEATVALGARSSLPYFLPQSPNSHAVLKGGCVCGKGFCLFVCLSVQNLSEVKRCDLVMSLNQNRRAGNVRQSSEDLFR